MKVEEEAAAVVAAARNVCPSAMTVAEMQTWPDEVERLPSRVVAVVASRC